MKQLIIVGAGGHGKVIADIALKMNQWESIAFLDDNMNLKSVIELEVKGKFAEIFRLIDCSDIFVGIGNNLARENIQAKLEQADASIPMLIHPSSVIGSSVTIERGTAVMAGVVINSGTKIGKGCIINTSASVDHDCIIEDYTHISPGVRLAGEVKIGKSTWLGIGSVVSNNTSICSNCIIGAGAVVVSDITEPGIYVGVPARKRD